MLESQKEKNHKMMPDKLSESKKSCQKKGWATKTAPKNEGQMFADFDVHVLIPQDGTALGQQNDFGGTDEKLPIHGSPHETHLWSPPRSVEGNRIDGRDGTTISA
ncbi:hypothetical protein [Desulfatibacillum alkenivorans]|uniref:hypothetical protein n=1 Tax=Desulfatibacillum alkenivorans TaxID=259354 RepID=UPI0014812C6D|nr:hypothetical protein [Desulfatibacillum alkenivorans]